MATDFLTSYDYYSSRRDMEVISNIVESLKKNFGRRQITSSASVFKNV